MTRRSLKIFFVTLILSMLIASIFPSHSTASEEGMFTPDQIVSLPLKRKGLKIKPSEIYDPLRPSISDAIVRVNIPTGGFGTGEFVSPNGLVLTNHHVGFDALVAASNEEHDYATNGFAAESVKGEMPATGYTLIVTKRVENVTDKVLEGLRGLPDPGRQEKISARMESIEKSEQAKNPGSTIRVQELNDGIFYYLYETQTIKDLRIVYAPPKSIGFFGGDPDNFEWTRHTGDFTFLRAYVAPNGDFAEYSPANVPYRPTKFLTISLDGIEEGDFVMLMGYPGGTTRFRESRSVQYSEEVSFPFIENYVRAWSSVLTAISEKEPSKAIPLQAQIFSLNNTTKVYQGNVAAMKRAGIAGERRELETRLSGWIAADSTRRAKYGDVLSGLERVSSKFYNHSRQDRVLSIFPSASTTQSFALVYEAINALNEGGNLGETEEEKAKKIDRIKAVFEGFEPVLEREMIKFFLKKIDELPREQKFDAAEDIFAGLDEKERREAEAALAEQIASEFDSADKVIAIYSSNIESLSAKYPKIVSLALGLGKTKKKTAEMTAEFNSEISALRLRYQMALSEMTGKDLYPDANATLRFSYGNIRGYSPREAVIYRPFTTLRGVIEKDSGVEPFDVPAKLKELHRKRDFGRYEASGSVPVNFLSTTDIIGGNSGSPILNRNGQQVGLVFDGNYEGLGNNIFFSEEYGRTISVDIRYVLFLTEKFGDSGWILKELDIKQRKSGRNRRR